MVIPTQKYSNCVLASHEGFDFTVSPAVYRGTTHAQPASPKIVLREFQLPPDFLYPLRKAFFYQVRQP